MIQLKKEMKSADHLKKDDSGMDRARSDHAICL